MLNKLRIGSRLSLLIAVQAIVLGVVGIAALAGLNFSANTTSLLNKNIIEQVKLNQLNESLRADLLETVNQIQNRKLPLEKAQEELLSARNLIVNNWDEYKEDRPQEEVTEINNSLGASFQAVLRAVDELQKLVGALVSTQNQAEGLDLAEEPIQAEKRFSDFVESELPKLIRPFMTELNERVNEQQLISESLFNKSIEKGEDFLYSSTVLIIVGFSIASLLGFLIHRSITRPIRQISATVAKVAEGDYYARTAVVGTDELGELGQAFDGLLQDKVATLVQAEKENEQLNEAVIGLLQAVSKLSQRDLTVKVPVTEDVTGPVADALNQLTSETSRVLLGVRGISDEVAKASTKVKEQSDTVIAVASDEQREVEATARELARAVEVMNNIANLARVCNLAAEEAISTTHTALDTVTGTVNGINGIRETIHETEKRIKRLGERSQEITRAINLINTISERTHILALNASMHAASAGEAGRGFAVVADEVQRLAENARDATSQISTLVSNIQIETSDTVATMNNVISQVVSGSRLAEKAGEQMQKTKERTANLVESVRQIAERSQEQARLSNELQNRAGQIQESTQKTRQQLQEQTLLTNRLVQYAKELLAAVQVFKLPEAQAGDSEETAASTFQVAVTGVQQQKVS